MQALASDRTGGLIHNSCGLKIIKTVAGCTSLKIMKAGNKKPRFYQQESVETSLLMVSAIS